MAKGPALTIRISPQAIQRMRTTTDPLQMQVCAVSMRLGYEELLENEGITDPDLRAKCAQKLSTNYLRGVLAYCPTDVRARWYSAVPSLRTVERRTFSLSSQHGYFQ